MVSGLKDLKLLFEAIVGEPRNETFPWAGVDFETEILDIALDFVLVAGLDTKLESKNQW